MSHTATIKFAPLTTLERVNDERWQRPGRTMYDAGALTFVPGKPTVPLLVDHDDTREIGRVRELTRFEDTDGPWLAGLCTITDPPEWLRRGARASFSYKNLQKNPDMFGCEVVRRAIVTELSVLSPAREPAEPLAQVLTLHPTKKPEPAPTVIRRSVPAVRRISPSEESEELQRRLDFYGDTVPFELVHENMKDEIQALKGRRC